MFCSNCGSELKNNDIFCGKCGYKVRETVDEKKNVVEQEISKSIVQDIKPIKLDKNIYAYLISALVVFMMIVPFLAVLRQEAYQVNYWSGTVSKAMDADLTIIDLVSLMTNRDIMQQNGADVIILPIMVVACFGIAIVCCGITYLNNSFFNKCVDEDMLKANMIVCISYGVIVFWLKFAMEKFAEELSSFSNGFAVSNTVWLMIITAIINYCVLFKAFENEESKEKI